MQKSKSNGRYILLFVILISALLALMLWSISTGSVSIPFREAWNILFHRSGQTGETYYTVIHEIRIPRVIAASLLGGALSVSGFLLQTFFGNPIAGPYILGISSGARLVVALTMVFLLSRGIMTTPAVMILAAFIGSMLAMGFVLAVSFRIKNMSLLVVCGIMIGYICTAVTDLVVTFADDSNIVNLHNWSLGSFSGISWSTAFQADRRLPDGRKLCAKYGSKREEAENNFDSSFQFFIRYCNRFCRPYLFCRRCRPASDEDADENSPSSCPDPGMLSGGSHHNAFL